MNSAHPPSGPPPSAGVPQDPHAHLEEVLREPAFTRWQLRQLRSQTGESTEGWLTSLANWVADLRGRISDFIESLFRGWRPRAPSGSGWLDGLVGMGEVLRVGAWMLVAVLTLVIVVIAVKLIRDHRRQTAGVTLSREQIREALEAGEALAADSGQWKREADRLVEEKDLRLAFRAMYLALLSGLHRAQRIDFRRNRTNWVYVTHFRGEADDRSLFAGLTERFDDVWYGQRAPDRAAFHRVREDVDALLTRGGADG